ncbi:flagellar basal body L-ring protein FlgH [Rhodospirillaceae bacterium]|nr:flagellar basal body L-ring protein FlgH [Alphaproteobacteria bacterium]MDC1442352.1 flagellar basal body L-ring protein FlgH [Rhodospirillaceae bacterium]
MFIKINSFVLKGCLLATFIFSSISCTTLDKLANVGASPELSGIANPNQTQGYKPVSMPMPMPMKATRQPNSLWQEGSRAFFKDQRASEVGDIITVVVAIEDEAQLDNRTRQNRTATEDFGIGNLFGLENLFGNVLPEPVTNSTLVDVDSKTANDGRGRIDREETVNLRIAAVVTQRLPNGNLVLFGRQEIRVNFEIREVVVGGIIRPQDIASANTVSYDQMAEARIAYGGRGQLQDLQQMRYGAEVLQILMPF